MGRGGGRDSCDEQPPAGRVNLLLPQIEARLSPPSHHLIHSPTHMGLFRALCRVQAQETTCFSILLMKTFYFGALCVLQTNCYFCSFGEILAVVALLASTT